jgi:transcriptional regulator
MAEFVRTVGFGTLFAATPDGPRVAHIPALLDGEMLRFHLANGNALTRHLDGTTALYVVNGADAYVSPDWYGEPDQVPTWNYMAVELEGTVLKLSQDDTIVLVETLTAEQEARLEKEPWTRHKMRDGLFATMIRSVTGFALEVKAWRGTAKLGQNKSNAARKAAADAIEANGRAAVAHWMRNLDA